MEQTGGATGKAYPSKTALLDTCGLQRFTDRMSKHDSQLDTLQGKICKDTVTVVENINPCYLLLRQDQVREERPYQVGHLGI